MGVGVVVGGEADIHAKEMKAEMGAKLAVSGEQSQRRSRERGAAAPQITTQLVIDVSG